MSYYLDESREKVRVCDDFFNEWVELACILEKKPPAQILEKYNKNGELEIFSRYVSGKIVTLVDRRMWIDDQSRFKLFDPRYGFMIPPRLFSEIKKEK